MDPAYSPTVPHHPLSLGAELDFSSPSGSASSSARPYHSHTSSLDEADFESAELDPTLALSHQLDGLSGLQGGDLASELAAGSLEAELSGQDHYHDDATDDDDDDGQATASRRPYAAPLGHDAGMVTPPRRAAGRRRGAEAGGAATSPSADPDAQAASYAPGSLAAELDPHHTPPPRSRRSSRPASPSDLSLSSYTSNVREMEESLRSTQEFLDRLKGVGGGGPTATPSSSYAAAAGTEDTTQLEHAAATLIRSLYDCANERETQIRELREILRVLGRDDSEWVAALAMVDALPDEDGAGPGHGYVGTGLHEDPHEDFLGFATPLDPRSSSHALGYEPGTEPANGAHPGTGATGPTQRAPLATHLSHLLSTTSGLITSLGTIHEHSQVSKSAMGDAARRLRSLKTVMAQWRAEVDGVERSRRWIEERQGGELPHWVGGAQDGNEEVDDVREWTRVQMQRFERVLEEAEGRARVLLTPVPFCGVEAA